MSNHTWPLKIISKLAAPHQVPKSFSSYRVDPYGECELPAGVFPCCKEVVGIGATLTKGPGDRPQHSAVDALPLGFRSHLAIR